MILYFSGTGNSRYFANLLKIELGVEIFSINEALSSGKQPKPADGESLVFVVPTYCYHIPAVVEDFIRKTEFKAAPVWFVMSCGAGIGGAGAANRALCEEKGLEYKGTYTLVAPDNYLLMYEPSDREEAEKRLATFPQKAKVLAEMIRNGRSFIEGSSFLGRQISILGSKLFNAAFVRPEKFSVTDKCVSCGLCARSCPLNNVEMSEGKPAWGQSCVQCLSCICVCPKDAIEYGKGTKGRRRHYVMPDGKIK